MPIPKPAPITSALDRDLAEAAEYVERTKARAKGTYRPPKLKPLPKAKLKRKHHLVIGDSHAHPDDPNHRFEWLGAMIKDRCPDTCIDIGDSADMPSLFGYEKGNKGPLFEGRRYWHDVDAYLDARERMHRAMGKTKAALIKCEGNHENRIDRMLEAEPRFRGIVGPHNLMDEEFGWQVYPYGEYVEIDGILYTHAFTHPKGGATIAGVMPARAAIQSIPGSHCRVQGHSHIFQTYEAADSGSGIHNRKITGIHAGCYFDPESNAHRWAGYSVNGWRSGILELWVEGGQIHDLHWTSYDAIHQRYA